MRKYLNFFHPSGKRTEDEKGDVSVQEQIDRLVLLVNQPSGWFIC